MKLTIESTTKIVHLNGVEARVWEGETPNGVPVHCFITLISMQPGHDPTEFEKELLEQRKPSPEVEAIPLRLIL